jgi:hypothetical protein
MIKEFLIDKLNNYHSGTLAEIKGKLTSNMPTWETQHLEGNALPFWGFEDNGIWIIWPTYMGGYVFDLDIIYYTDNGEIHTIGSKYDQVYFDFYKKIYESNSVRVLKPVVCEQIITDNDHLPKNTWYYSCFQNPDNLLGVTVESQSFVQTPGNLYRILNKYVDLLDKLKIAVKSNSDGLFPRETNTFSIFSDANDIYYTLFDKCTTADNDVICNYIKNAQDYILGVAEDLPKDEISNYTADNSKLSLRDLNFSVTFYKDEYKILRVPGNQMVYKCFNAILQHVLGKHHDQNYYTLLEVADAKNKIILKVNLIDYDPDDPQWSSEDFYNLF